MTDTQHQVNFSTRGRFVGVVERKSSTPEESVDDGLLKTRGILGNLGLEMFDHLVRVTKGTTNLNLGAIYETVKAIGWLLPVIGAHMASVQSSMVAETKSRFR